MEGYETEDVYAPQQPRYEPVDSHPKTLIDKPVPVDVEELLKCETLEDMLDMCVRRHADHQDG